MKLVQFLMKLNNEVVQVEMKNGTVIQGTMTGCDTSMNTHLKQVTMIVKRRIPVRIDHLTVRGPNIRYIFLPEHIDLDKKLLDDCIFCLKCWLTRMLLFLHTRAHSSISMVLFRFPMREEPTVADDPDFLVFNLSAMRKSNYFPQQ
ncbi:unnamed protein product [Amoebophrya sp. A120]|nr:unnamed protein product [Amoebophrya sp. A120]|eukprot:GSA120T00006136001.1